LSIGALKLFKEAYYQTVGTLGSFPSDFVFAARSPMRLKSILPNNDSASPVGSKSRRGSRLRSAWSTKLAFATVRLENLHMNTAICVALPQPFNEKKIITLMK
jgi:hypothetical protein